MHASAITNILATFGRQEINAKYICAMLGNTDNMLRNIIPCASVYDMSGSVFNLEVGTYSSVNL